MIINNLEINILYYLCDPLNGQVQDAAIDSKEILEAFADIPDDHVIAAMDSMAKARLILMDHDHSRLSITPSGINRLQSTIACRLHHIDRCRCDGSVAGSPSEPVAGINPKGASTPPQST